MRHDDRNRNNNKIGETYNRFWSKRKETFKLVRQTKRRNKRDRLLKIEIVSGK